MRNALRMIQNGGLGEATTAIRQKLHELSGLGAPVDKKPDEIFGAAQRPPSFDELTVLDARSRVPGTGGTFTAAVYTGPAGRRSYKLFMPAGQHASPLPLVVMLHGCTQSADDFAVGTGMNELAADARCVVVYPEQELSANGLKCWNWFKSSDQRRDRGEPAIIAGITREVVAIYGLDAKRVYVAGLSAGGAMAVVMGRTYPDLYAAVGVHSGIPYAVAHDAPSAFAAMKGTAGQPGHTKSTLPPLMPTIVLHGDRDKTVHPSNGQKLAEQFSPGDAVAHAEPTTECGRPERGRPQRAGARARGGRAYTRTLLRNPDGKVVVEYWLVHGAGHAWFGGNPQGSHTDAKGPDASTEMLRFFLEHELTHPRN